MGYTNEEFEKELKYKKNKLHIKYISGISFGCVCAVIILQCSDGKTFQNCISVSSTVVSIILSVIAIILSVTGGRSTNEIRNKISDATDRLSKTTIDAESVNENFKKIAGEQLNGFNNIKNDLETLLIRLENIESETMSANEMLSQLVSIGNDTENMNEKLSDDFVIEVVSRMRKVSTKESVNVLMNKVIELAIEYADKKLNGELMEKELIEAWERIPNRDFPELSDQLIDVFIGIIICLRALDYSNNVKEKILEMIS